MYIASGCAMTELLNLHINTKVFVIQSAIKDTVQSLYRSYTMRCGIIGSCQSAATPGATPGIRKWGGTGKN